MTTVAHMADGSRRRIEGFDDRRQVYLVYDYAESSLSLTDGPVRYVERALHIQRVMYPHDFVGPLESRWEFWPDDPLVPPSQRNPGARVETVLVECVDEWASRWASRESLERLEQRRQASADREIQCLRPTLLDAARRAYLADASVDQVAADFGLSRGAALTLEVVWRREVVRRAADALR